MTQMDKPKRKSVKGLLSPHVRLLATPPESDAALPILNDEGVCVVERAA